MHTEEALGRILEVFPWIPYRNSSYYILTIFKHIYNKMSPLFNKQLGQATWNFTNRLPANPSPSIRATEQSSKQPDKLSLLTSVPFSIHELSSWVIPSSAAFALLPSYTTSTYSNISATSHNYFIQKNLQGGKKPTHSIWPKNATVLFRHSRHKSQEASLAQLCSQFSNTAFSLSSPHPSPANSWHLFIQAKENHCIWKHYWGATEQNLPYIPDIWWPILCTRGEQLTKSVICLFITAQKSLASQKNPYERKALLPHTPNDTYFAAIKIISRKTWRGNYIHKKVWGAI